MLKRLQDLLLLISSTMWAVTWLALVPNQAGRSLVAQALPPPQTINDQSLSSMERGESIFLALGDIFVS